MVVESPRGLFTLASMRNTVLNITDSVRRGLNQLDTFYNPTAPQEEENTAMIAKIYIMDLQEKPLIGSPSLKTKRVLVLDWLSQYNQIQLHQ